MKNAIKLPVLFLANLLSLKIKHILLVNLLDICKSKAVFRKKEKTLFQPSKPIKAIVMMSNNIQVDHN